MGDTRPRAASAARSAPGLAVSAVLCVAELVGGWLTNSLALLSDAAHMLTDVARARRSTLFALWIGRAAGERAARRSATTAPRSWPRS